ncbi:hypothetical protein HNQ77_000001 [Silvibacterium bohemicum]|uniref:Oxidoreductase molybdopterin-binding domain-containing protein n=1 Tax=Silvibacterium bohemicum TaxID=1577686 RepID=A0A841JLI6_9BACT|nr:carboxypeptidase regulatory-like domain-containing protein [Silvibacterium bohemicum]MBB6142063.1 hypothetical protein [Silvibacterium bohemicum]
MLPVNSKSLAAVVFAVVISVCAFAQQEKSVPITIHVADVTGTPISGAAVTIIPSASCSQVDAQTDGTGTLAVALKPCSYQVSVYSSGFFPLAKSLNVQNSAAQILQFALTVATGTGPVISLGPNLNPEHPALTVMLPAEVVGALYISAGPDHTKTIDLATLKTMPQRTVKFHNVHTKAEETYTGVPLIDLLASLGVPHGKDLHGKPLSDYIVATGSDGYKAVLALAELDPEFHPGDVIVADAMDGKPLDATNGPFKLVVTEDKRPARSVHNLVLIEVKTAE